MKTSAKNSGNSSGRANEPVKQQQVNEHQKGKNPSEKKHVSIKDMPPIDGARPGVV